MPVGVRARSTRRPKTGFFSAKWADSTFQRSRYSLTGSNVGWAR